MCLYAYSILLMTSFDVLLCYVFYSLIQQSQIEHSCISSDGPWKSSSGHTPAISADLTAQLAFIGTVFKVPLRHAALTHIHLIASIGV